MLKNIDIDISDIFAGIALISLPFPPSKRQLTTLHHDYRVTVIFWIITIVMAFNAVCTCFDAVFMCNWMLL